MKLKVKKFFASLLLRVPALSFADICLNVEGITLEGVGDLDILAAKDRVN
jgi:hypothetical protein